MEIDDEQNIETLNEIVELIRMQFSEEELKERINDYYAQCWLSDAEDEHDEPLDFNPELAEIEEQRTTEIMNFLHSPQSAENPEGIDDILAKYDDILAKYKKQ